MKRLILILIINFIAIFSSVAQPASVQKAFEEKFPNMTHVTWSNENVTEWQADFLFDGAKFCTVFTSKGTWIETIRIIIITELPQDVRNSILTKFPHWEITELNRTEKAKSGISYEVNLKKGRERKNIAFKEDGSLIQ